MKLIHRLCLVLVLLMMISPLAAQVDLWPLITFENFDALQPLVTIPQDAEWGRTFFISESLLAITSGEEIHIWDVVRKERVHVLGLDVGGISKQTTALAGSKLVIGASIMDTGRIRIWDLEKERWLGPVLDLGHGFTALAVSPKQEYMALAYYDVDKGAMIELRDYPSGDFIRVVSALDLPPAENLVFLDDTHLVGAERWSGSLIYNLETGEEVFLYQDEDGTHGDYSVDQVAVSASGQYLAWRRNEAFAEVWDWQEKLKLPIDGGEGTEFYFAYWTMVFSPDEDFLVSFYKDEYSESRPQHSYLTAWNLKTYERVTTEFGVEHNDMAVVSDLFDIAFNPDGRSIAVLYQDKIELWGVPAKP